MRAIAKLIILLATWTWMGIGVHATTPDDKGRAYDLLFMEAMVQRQQGHADAAMDLLKRCTELRPRASEAWFFLAQYYQQLEQHDIALSLLLRADSLAPGTITYMETLAQAYVDKEEWEDAISVVERMYEADKGREDLLEMLYRLSIQLHDYKKAITYLERMELIDGKSERISLAKSSLYIQLDSTQAAVAEARDLAQHYPNDLNYRTLYANMLMMDEQTDSARAILASVLAEEPNNYRAQMALRAYYNSQDDSLRADSLLHAILTNEHTTDENRVNLLRQQISQSEYQGGDSTRVLQLFHEVLALPGISADMPEFCAAYMNLKKMPRDSVKAMLQMALQMEPDKASARLQLVQFAWEEHDDEQLIALCQEARQYNPDEMAFYYYQGMAYYRQEDADHALDAFRNGISVITDESNPEIVSDFYAVMGDLYHLKGLPRQAYEAYDSCLQWKEDNIECMNNYAYYLSLEGKELDKAERMSHRTITANPKSSTYLDTYAWILFMQKRYNEARIYIDEALRYDSLHSSVILEHGGDIYAMSGDMEQALNLWQQALTEDPENKALIRKIKRKKYIK